MITKEEYINQELIKPYICNDLKEIINKINNGEKIIITKFGDGEYLNMTLKHINNNNIDYDKYTYEYGIKLREAFINLIDRSENENIYICKWHNNNDNETNKFNLELYYNYVIENNKEFKQIPYVNYHFIYLDFNEILTDNIKEFVKTIKNSTKYKIIISNNKNKKLSIIFNGNSYIEIPDNCWFSNNLYDSVKNNLIEFLNLHNDAIVLIAGGMASKILIADITSIYPNISFIDIGSSFDLLARKEPTRSIHYGRNDDYKDFYNKLLEYLKEVLPDNYDEL